MRREAEAESWTHLFGDVLRRLVATLRQGRVRRTVLGLLAVDGLFIGFYCVTRALRALDFDIGWFARDEFRITVARGYPEMFNYAKTLVVVALAVRLARISRQPVYLGLACLFFVILLDDSLEIHERVGAHLAARLELVPRFGLRPEDLGELLTWGLLGASIAPGILLGFLRSEIIHRVRGAVLLLPVCLLFIFGVLVDQLYHIFSDAFPGAGLLIDATEDGGEMVAISLAVGLALGLQFLPSRASTIAS